MPGTSVGGRGPKRGKALGRGLAGDAIEEHGVDGLYQGPYQPNQHGEEGGERVAGHQTLRSACVQACVSPLLHGSDKLAVLAAPA